MMDREENGTARAEVKEDVDDLIFRAEREWLTSDR